MNIRQRMQQLHIDHGANGADEDVHQLLDRTKDLTFISSCLDKHVEGITKENLLHQKHLATWLYTKDTAWSECPCVPCYRRRRDNAR